jgi:MFS family permease
VSAAPAAADLGLRQRSLAERFGAGLPRAVWLLEAGMLVNSIGTGLLLPFILIYLHDARGFSLSTAGLVAGTFGLVGIAATPLAGSLIDRLGGRSTFFASLLVLAGGYALFPLIHEPWQAFLFMALVGVGNGAFWPSLSTLLIAATPADRRHAAFALNRTACNLGLGVGAVLGGLLITADDAGTFTALFLVNAVTFLVLAASACFVIAPARRARTERPGSYRDVARDRVFLTFVGLNTIFVAAGYAQLEAAVPVFAKHEAHVTETAIGTIFLANVAAVVLAQMPVCKLIEGRRRMHVLAVMCAIWASAWVLVALAGLWQAAIASVAIAVAVAVFGIGECLHGPITATVAADLAPEGLRGRYMALSTGSFAVGFAIGPAAAGGLLAVAPQAVFPLAAVVCVLAGIASLGLERRLPAAARLTPAR